LEANPEGEYYLSSLLLFLQNTTWLSIFDADVIVALIFIIILIFLSALVSSSEVAYFSLTAEDQISFKKSERKPHKQILQLLKDEKYLLATILVTNNLFNVAIIILSHFSLHKILYFIKNEIYVFLLDVILITFLLVLFGEIVPKIFARSNRKKVATIAALPLSVFSKIAWPLNAILIRSSNIIEERLSRNADNEVDINEIEGAIDLTIDENVDKDENRILKGIINFGTITAKQIAKPRMDIVALDYESDFGQVHQLIIGSGHSRIPVYKEDLDNIEGILYAKDVLKYLQREKSFKWQKLLRNVYFVPETKKIDDLLREFQKKRTHLAIVFDEFGGTMGLITMEDILEEILGEIQDEYDEKIEIEYQKLDDYNFSFEGKTLINDLTKVLDVDNGTFEDVKGEADSLAGLILEITGTLPKQNDKILYENYLFNILSVNDNRIESVKITILEDDKLDN